MRLLLLLLTVGLCHAQEYQLVWEDNFDIFDTDKWDHEITAWGGGNNEFEVYADDQLNSYVQDGILFLKPTLLVNNTNPLTGQPFGEEFLNSGVLDLNAMYGRCTQGENGGCYRTGANDDIPPIMSARIRTAERFFFKYGRVEIRAKMPTGDWLWPAIWLLPEDWVYGGWPVSGEIDIIEIEGNEDWKNADGSWTGFQKMGTTLHWGTSPDQNRYELTTASKLDEATPYGRNFHDFVTEWTENGISMSVDGELVANFPDPLINEDPNWTGFYDFGNFPDGTPNPWSTLNAPFDREFHFILNVAVGGTNFFFPEDGINRGGDPQYTKPWSNGQSYTDAFNSFYERVEDWYWTWTKEGDDNAMQVDYIRVYQQL